MRLPPEPAEKRILKQAKGFYGKRKNVYTVAKNVLEKGLTYRYVGRKLKKTRIPRFLDCAYQRGRSGRRAYLFPFYPPAQ